MVSASTIETKFNIHDAVMVQVTKATRVRNRASRKDVVSIGSHVPATIIGVGLRGRDARIDYLVKLDNETVAFVPETNIELKDYSLF